MRARVTGSVLLASFAAALSASAQEWRVSAEAGRLSAALDPGTASTSIALGVRYAQPTGGFAVSFGVPTGADPSLWAGAGASRRVAFRRGGLMAGLDLSGSAFVKRERSEAQSPLLPGTLGGPLDPGSAAARVGRAFAWEIVPLIGYEGGRVQLHARTGVSSYAARFEEQRADRTVGLADIRVTLLPTPALALIPAVRGFRAEGEMPIHAALSAVHVQSRAKLWATVGHWMGRDVGTPWEVGAALELHPRVSLEAGARHDSFDPLYGQPARTAWRIGLSVQVGGLVGPARLPVPSRYVDGRATIRIAVSQSPAPPSIAGAFNGWKPAPMQRSGDDWTYSVTVAPGVYEYAFVNERGEWFVPEGVPGRKQDGMGGHVAVLVVQ